MADNEAGAEVEMLPFNTTPMGDETDPFTPGNDDDVDVDDDIIDVDDYKPTTEGDKTTTPNGHELLENESSADVSDNDSAGGMEQFLNKKNRPTSSGEPSHNLPKRVIFSPWCICTYSMLSILFIVIIITTFAPILFQDAIQLILHYIVDDNEYHDGKGAFDANNIIIMFFCIFDAASFAMCGNIDYLLCVACGYLYGQLTHEWVYGAIIYLAFNTIGCCFAFAIGRTLFTEKLYFYLSKYEKYRYFYRTYTDHTVVLGVAMHMNAFIPSGITSYLLSLSGMTWRSFLLVQSTRIINASIMAFAGYHIRQYAPNDPSRNTNINLITYSGAYKQNDVTYYMTITFCVLSALLLIVFIFSMYFQWGNLMLGDLKRRGEEYSASRDDNESMTHSNDDSDDSDEESSDTLNWENEKDASDSDSPFLFQETAATEKDDIESNNGAGTVTAGGPLNIKESSNDESKDIISKDVNDSAAIEMEELTGAKNTDDNSKKQSSKHKRLGSKSGKKKKKKRKKKKNQTSLWSLTFGNVDDEPESMLFEEGPQNENDDPLKGQIVIKMKENPNKENNDAKASKIAKTLSFLKKNKNNNDDAGNVGGSGSNPSTPSAKGKRDPNAAPRSPR